MPNLGPILPLFAVAAVFAVMLFARPLVATLNPGPPEVGTAIMAYLLMSAVTIVPDVSWRQPIRS